MPKKTITNADAAIEVNVIQFQSLLASFRRGISLNGTTVAMRLIYTNTKRVRLLTDTRLSIRGKVVIEFRFNGVYEPKDIKFTKQAGDDQTDPSGKKDFPERLLNGQSCFVRNDFKDQHAVYKFQFAIADDHGNIGVTDPIITHDGPSLY